MIQLSLDGRRLYVTNSLYSTWDNQFYPGASLVAAARQLRARRASDVAVRMSEERCRNREALVIAHGEREIGRRQSLLIDVG